MTKKERMNKKKESRALRELRIWGKRHGGWRKVVLFEDDNDEIMTQADAIISHGRFDCGLIKGVREMVEVCGDFRILDSDWVYHPEWKGSSLELYADQDCSKMNGYGKYFDAVSELQSMGFHRPERLYDKRVYPVC